jgi:hypothetical protein
MAAGGCGGMEVAKRHQRAAIVLDLDERLRNMSVNQGEPKGLM